MNTILEVENLTKSFEQTIVLNQINFRVEEGEFVAVMGQSGSGKSTLLYSVSGMDSFDGGKVIYDGNDLSKMKESQISDLRLNKMGFIFQHSCLLKNLSIHDNIAIPGLKANQRTRQEVNQTAMELMKKTGIDGIASHDIRKVSGGQLQRAAICRALINHPKMLFGDEPTGALNSSATKEVMDIINHVNAQGMTVMIVTHDAKVAARADRVIYLMDGNIHSEYTLGRYQNEIDENEQREKALSKWLEENGF